MYSTPPICTNSCLFLFFFPLKALLVGNVFFCLTFLCLNDTIEFHHDGLLFAVSFFIKGLSFIDKSFFMFYTENNKSNGKEKPPKKRRYFYMALTRKLLSAMGIDAEKIDEIINAHTDTVNGLKDEIEKFKKDALLYDETKKSLDKVQKELDEVKKNPDKDVYKVKYEAVKEEFKDFKAQIEKQKVESNKKEAYKKVLTECSIDSKRFDAILRVTDFENIELDEDGNIKDVDKIKEDIDKTWDDFKVTEGSKGASTSTPPSSTGGKMTKEDILKIKDASERQQAMADNHELFGF